MITSIEQLDPQAYYNYTDYLVWQFRERVELLRGRLFQMAAPNVKHQQISLILSVRLFEQLKGQPCKIFTAPFDVCLPLPPQQLRGKKIDTVVQPDLCIICDAEKLDAHGCIGAPDLIIEILSPGNSKKEMRSKYEIYEAAGVREYWIFDPEHNTVFCYHLDETTAKFVSSSMPLFDDERLNSQIFPNLSIDLGEVFSK